MEFAAELQASLREFIASGIVEVRENGGCVASFSGMSWEVRGDGEKPLLHLWSQQFNLTRRVLAITDHSEHRLALADNSLTFALLWLRHVRESNGRGAITGVRIILPKEACATVAHRHPPARKLAPRRARGHPSVTKMGEFREPTIAPYPDPFLLAIFCTRALSTGRIPFPGR